MATNIEIECFYRLLPQLHALGCDEEADFHYSPYQIFVMETRLYPLIYNLYPNKNIDLYFRGIYDEGRNKMVMHLEFRELADTSDPFIENNKLYISEENLKLIKQKIGEITSIYEKYALIDVKELYKSSNKKYPFSYLQSILPYTGITSEYNPFVRPEGIYLRFNPKADYNTAYYEVVKYILERIDDFYKRGVVVLNDIVDNREKDKLIENWELERVDVNVEVGELYEPTWEDYRFARNITDFMLGKIAGDPYIRFNLPDNLVKRHFIIQNLQQENIELIVESSILKVSVINLEKSLKIAALVTSGEALGKGRVLILGANRPSYIYLFSDYSNKKYGLTGISYITNNPETPYIFSLLLPNNEYASSDQLKEEFRNYTLDRLIDVSKVTKLRNMSPHEIIEQEYKK